MLMVPLQVTQAQTQTDFLEIGSIYFKKPVVENQTNRVYSVVKNTSTNKDFSGLIKITFKNQSEVVLDSTTQCLSVIANDSDAVFMDITPPKTIDELKTIVEIFPNNSNTLITSNTKTNQVDKDNDGDGIGNLADTDDDNDGLPDNQETAQKTDPKNPDTDKDTIKDGKEVATGTSPTNNDTDGDKIADNKDFYPLDPLLSSPPKTFSGGGSFTNPNSQILGINFLESQNEPNLPADTQTKNTNNPTPIYGKVLGLFTFNTPKNPTTKLGEVNGISTPQTEWLDDDKDNLINTTEVKLGLNPNDSTTFLNLPDKTFYNFLWIVKYLCVCLVFYALAKHNKN
jgi:hypothetical protein